MKILILLILLSPTCIQPACACVGRKKKTASRDNPVFCSHFFFHLIPTTNLWGTCYPHSDIDSGKGWAIFLVLELVIGRSRVWIHVCKSTHFILFWIDLDTVCVWRLLLNCMEIPFLFCSFTWSVPLKMGFFVLTKQITIVSLEGVFLVLTHCLRRSWSFMPMWLFWIHSLSSLCPCFLLCVGPERCTFGAGLFWA